MAEDRLRQGDHNGFEIEELDPKIYKNLLFSIIKDEVR